jgi:DNA-binding LacI/PurR family transcriptional regulator
MITIKEIARLAGVSPKTAERALSGATKDKRRDARERADRVRQIAETYGYQPSELALAFRRGSSRSFGFLVDILTDQFLAAAVETAMDEAWKQKYKIALRLARFDEEQTAEAVKAFLASGMEGIITSCTPEQLPADLMETLEQRRYPFFTLCGRSRWDFSSAAPDYTEALPQAVAHLARRGHKKVTLCLFAGKELDNSVTGEIFRASCSACGVMADFRVHDQKKQAALLAEEGLTAVILYGKYSMRIYLDRCRELNRKSDVIGIYNEWTFAAAQTFDLCGVILEQAEETVRSAVKQLFARCGGGENRHLSCKARFVPSEAFNTIKVADLANQLLFEQP